PTPAGSAGSATGPSAGATAGAPAATAGVATAGVAAGATLRGVSRRARGCGRRGRGRGRSCGRGRGRGRVGALEAGGARDRVALGAGQVREVIRGALKGRLELLAIGRKTADAALEVLDVQ